MNQTMFRGNKRNTTWDSQLLKSSKGECVGYQKVFLPFQDKSLITAKVIVMFSNNFNKYISYILSLFKMIFWLRLRSFLSYKCHAKGLVFIDQDQMALIFASKSYSLISKYTLRLVISWINPFPNKPCFHVSVIQVFWQHCGKRRNCS